MTEIFKFVCEEGGMRLDSYLAAKSDSVLSRSQTRKLIDDGRVTVNGGYEKPSYITREHDEIVVEILPPEEIELHPENIPLDIVYEDAYLAVINKQQGLTVHPSETQACHTLVNAIMYHIKTLSGINGELRPGIVHRLDKNTSGLIVIAKSDRAHRGLSAQLENKTCRRDYVALLFGNVKNDSGVIDAPIGRCKSDRKKMDVVLGGKRAITEYRIKARYQKYTLVEFSLKTGRTHQIRVHAKYIGHPVVGDNVYYGSKQPFETCGQLLHAYHLSFEHPITGKRMDFYAEIPDYFQKILNGLQ